MQRSIGIFTLMAALSCAPLSAQTAPAADNGPSWTRLENIPSGLGIHVKARHDSGNCAFKSASETELICANSNGSLRTYPRADIKVVQLRHRGRSALAGMAIGAGGGAIAGVSTCKKGDIVGPGACALVLGVPLGLIGALVGVSTDFTHSTVYRAP